jgi:hypothetical protein
LRLALSIYKFIILNSNSYSENMPALAKQIEIFYPGKHTASDGRKLDFSASKVAKWAAAGQRVPLVPGHPQDDQPVMGYATKLKFTNNRLVVTEVEDVDPTFQAIVNSKQLNRVSVKLRPTSNGDWELGHIGFLGTSPPSLEGLATAEFSKSGEIFVMAEETDLEFAQRELELADREAEFAAKQAAFAAVQKWSPKVAKLVAEGKVLPVEEAPLMACFARLDTGDSIEFSRDGKDESLNPAEFIANLLSGTKARVTYGEVSKATAGASGGDDACFKSYDDNTEEAKEAGEMHAAILATGVDPKDSVAYQAAMKKQMKGGK